MNPIGRLPYSAWLVFGAVLGAAVGFSVSAHDLEGAVVGGVAGLFAAMGMHSNRALASASVMAALALVGVVAIVVIEAGLLDRRATDEAGFIWRDASVELRPVRKLKGITLGTRLDEVGQRLGTFETDAAWPPAEGARYYLQRSSRIRLRVVGERVTRVSYECGPDPDDTRLNRIGCWAREARIVEVFGQGARRRCPKAHLPQDAIAYDVLDTGTRYVVLAGFVRGIIVMEPDELEGATGGDMPWQGCA